MQPLSINEALKVTGRDDLAKTASADEPYTFGTPNATFISVIRAYTKQASAAELSTCLAHADFWCIRDACDSAIAKLADCEEKPLRDTDYALVKEAGDNTTLRKYAAYDADTTVQSSIAFVAERPQYPLEWRKEAASRLLSRADQYDANLPEYVATALHKSAGLGYPSEEGVTDAMIARLNSAPIGSEDLTSKLAMLLDHMIDNEDLRFDETFTKQAVAALEQYDVETGLTDHYGRGVDLPEDIIGMTAHDLEKIAGVKLAVELVNGHTVFLDQLDAQILGAIDPGLSKVAYDELADILPTLPKTDADLLVRLCS